MSPLHPEPPHHGLHPSFVWGLPGCCNTVSEESGLAGGSLCHWAPKSGKPENDLKVSCFLRPHHLAVVQREMERIIFPQLCPTANMWLQSTLLGSLYAVEHFSMIPPSASSWRALPWGLVGNRHLMCLFFPPENSVRMLPPYNSKVPMQISSWYGLDYFPAIC